MNRGRRQDNRKSQWPNAIENRARAKTTLANSSPIGY
jgi:hypothetical protein